MQTRAVIASMLLAAICAPWMQSSATGETQMLPAPGFHHLHLNSLDPAAAIDFLHQAVREHVEVELGRLAGAAIAEQRPAAVQQGRRRAGDRAAVGELALSAGT